MKRFSPLYIAAFLLVVVSCIEAIDLTQDEIIVKLVVEAQITTSDEQEPIRIFNNAPYTSDPNEFQQPAPVSDAVVSLTDANGNVLATYIYSSESRSYEIDRVFSAEVGSTYVLDIQWNEASYQSQPVTVEPVPEMDTIYYEFIPQRNTVGIYVDFTDLPGAGNNYQWVWDGFYNVKTSLPGPPDFPDTFNCCTECYVPQVGNNIVLYDDTFSDGNEIRKQFVTEIPMDDATDYLLNITQRSLTNEAYEFWRKLKVQRESEGGLFAPPPFNIDGNIYSLDDPNEKVLGFFTASDVFEDFVQVQRKRFTSFPPRRRTADCRTLPFADAEKPENWQ